MQHMMALRLVSTLLLFGRVVTAADAAAFSGAIISDLGPLISLFGEKVTMQFLSESMGGWEHIIFAMAPLGIITAIVSAIRVSGPSWLRAIIGRARECRGAVEVELMSSTSHDVCELWDGNRIVRIMGSATVVQLLYFPHHHSHIDKFGQATCGLYTLGGALEEGLLVKRRPWSFKRTCKCLIMFFRLIIYWGD